MDHTKQAITPAEAGRRMGRSQATVERMIRDGALPFAMAYRNSGSGRFLYVIPAEAFDRYMRGELIIDPGQRRCADGR